MELVPKLVLAKNLYFSLSTVRNQHHFKMRDIDSLDARKIKGKKYILVKLNSGRTFTTPLREFKLNKKGKIALGTLSVLTAGTIAASIAGFKYTKTDDGKVKITDEKVYATAEDIFIDEDDNVVDYTSDEINSVEYIANEETVTDEVTLAEAMDIDETTSVDETQYIENEYSNIRTLSVEGDSTRGIDAYNRIIDNYYDDIVKYGEMYGIDPAIIAALMMEEGGTTYDPNAEENMGAIGFGQVSSSDWNNHEFNTYNFITGEYDYYKLDVNDLKNNPTKQIEAIARMLQESAIRYHGNFSAITVCYNQGCGTVANITNNLINSGDYSSSMDVYNNENALLIFENDPYTYGNKDYTNRIVTYLDEILKNEVFGSSVATIKLPDGSVFNYETSIQNELSR